MYCIDLAFRLRETSNCKWYTAACHKFLIILLLNEVTVYRSAGYSRMAEVIVALSWTI